MLITDGVDTMYVEALQERAQMILDANIKEGEVVTVELSFNARSYETKDHETKYSTDIVVQKLGRLF